MSAEKGEGGMKAIEWVAYVIVMLAAIVLILRILGIIPNSGDAVVIAAEECRYAYYVGVL